MRDLDPNDPLDLVRLRTVSDEAVNKTRSACDTRLEMLRAFVGPYYPGDDDNKKKDRRPVNLFEMAVDIYHRGLTTHDPQVIVETEFEELLPTAKDFEIVLNRKIKRMRLEEALNICATESLFTIGVMCIGVGLSGGYESGPQVFAEPVLFPDLVLDLAAESWEQQSFVGHEFLVPMEWLDGNTDLLTDPRDKFVQWSRTQVTNNGRDWNRIGSYQFEDYEKLVRLRQLYLPRHKKTVLFAVDGPFQDALRVSDWDGPYCGPYIPLSFRTVPGNVFPLAPMIGLFDLDAFCNAGYSKAFREAENCKTIGLAQNPEDAAAIQAASDGWIVKADDPNSVVEKTFGGANQNVIAAANMAQQLFMKQGGNLDLLGGIAPSSGTVGQDRLLSEGATGRMKDMQQRMIGFETEVISSIAYWVWEDPTGEERFTKRLEGTSYSIPGTWSPETRKGKFLEFNFSMNPYAHIKRSPSEEAQFITQFLEQVIIPAMPMMQQDGAKVDWEGFVKLYARLNNAPNIPMLIKWQGGESMPQSEPDTPKKSPTSTRNYVRTNVQGGNVNPLADAAKQFSDSAGAMSQSLAQAG